MILIEHANKTLANAVFHWLEAKKTMERAKREKKEAYKQMMKAVALIQELKR